MITLWGALNFTTWGFADLETVNRGATAQLLPAAVTTVPTRLHGCGHESAFIG